MIIAKYVILITHPIKEIVFIAFSVYFRQLAGMISYSSLL